MKAKSKFKIFNVTYQSKGEETLVTLYAKDKREVKRILAGCLIVSIEKD